MVSSQWHDELRVPVLHESRDDRGLCGHAVADNGPQYIIKQQHDRLIDGHTVLLRCHSTQLCIEVWCYHSSIGLAQLAVLCSWVLCAHCCTLLLANHSVAQERRAPTVHQHIIKIVHSCVQPTLHTLLPLYTSVFLSP